MNTLEIHNLTKSFENKSVLNEVSISCKTGEVVGIFGRNGSGKSTLLKLIFGTLKADTITIQINSETILPKQIIPSEKVAYLPQDSFLPRGMRVRDAIALFYENDEQDKIFYAPGISKFANTMIGKLSMGELRYLEILLIGNLNHPFLILDEPFSMIEPIMKERVKEVIMGLKETKGILLTDHYYEDVMNVSNRTILVKNGNIVNITSNEDLRKYGYLSSI